MSDYLSRQQISTSLDEEIAILEIQKKLIKFTTDHDNMKHFFELKKLMFQPGTKLHKCLKEEPERTPNTLYKNQPTTWTYKGELIVRDCTLITIGPQKGIGYTLQSHSPSEFVFRVNEESPLLFGQINSTLLDIRGVYLKLQEYNSKHPMEIMYILDTN